MNGGVSDWENVEVAQMPGIGVVQSRPLRLLYEIMNPSRTYNLTRRVRRVELVYTCSCSFIEHDPARTIIDSTDTSTGSYARHFLHHKLRPPVLTFFTHLI
jgi:hypothetical protein